MKQRDSTMATWQSRARTLWWVWLLGAVLFGVGVFFPLLVAPQRWADAGQVAFITLGAGFWVAGLLAVLVDVPLKREMATDAMRQAIGFLLPEQLAEELPWLQTQPFVAIAHEHRITLTPIDGTELVTMHTYIRRRFKNVTSRTQDFRGLFDVREWLHEGYPSQVTYVHVIKDGEPLVTETVPAQRVAESEVGDLYIRRRSASDVQVSKGETVEMIAEGTETKHRNDMHMQASIYTTVRPRVTVWAPSDLRFVVGFGEHKGTEARNVASNEWRYSGILLPYQCIMIRWAPEAEAAEWQRWLEGQSGTGSNEP